MINTGAMPAWHLPHGVLPTTAASQLIADDFAGALLSDQLRKSVARR